MNSIVKTHIKLLIQSTKYNEKTMNSSVMLPSHAMMSAFICKMEAVSTHNLFYKCQMT